MMTWWGITSAKNHPHKVCRFIHGKLFGKTAAQDSSTLLNKWVTTYYWEWVAQQEQELEEDVLSNITLELNETTESVRQPKSECLLSSQEHKR